MAEGVGFEPTVGFPTLDFESSALNRTQPPFPGLPYFATGNCRPQLVVCKGKASCQLAIAMKITLTDGGIETRIIYEFKHLIGDFDHSNCCKTSRGAISCAEFFGVMAM